MSDDVLPLLKVHEYFRGMPDEALQEVLRHAQVTHHAAGSVVHEASVLLTAVGWPLASDRSACPRLARQDQHRLAAGERSPRRP